MEWEWIDRGDGKKRRMIIVISPRSITRGRARALLPTLAQVVNAGVCQDTR